MTTLARRVLALASLALFLDAGCRSSFPKPGEQDDDGPAIEEGPPGQVVPVDPAADTGARRLAPGLVPGDRIVRDARIELTMDRVGETAELPAGELVRSYLFRSRRYEDEVLAAAAGRPTTVRRTYFESFEKAELGLSGGAVKRKEGNQAVEGVRVRIAEVDGQLEVKEEALPPGVTEGDLEEVLILDTVGLSAFVPGREVEPGATWSVPIDKVAEVLGKKPLGADYQGTILARYLRRVLYDGDESAHIELSIDLVQTDRQEAEVPFAKKTRMVLSGELYYSFGQGRPLYLRASGPTTIEYTPQGEAPDALLAKKFVLQGEMTITIQFDRAR
ncbi:MAG: hypothetical protein HY720_05670 [Planctomycetes bacterium]|nr:hypothetical protein [Planctomycetota bacterium]